MNEPTRFPKASGLQRERRAKPDSLRRSERGSTGARRSAPVLTTQRVGSVDIPQEAFLAVLRVDE